MSRMTVCPEPDSSSDLDSDSQYGLSILLWRVFSQSTLLLLLLCNLASFGTIPSHQTSFMPLNHSGLCQEEGFRISFPLLLGESFQDTNKSLDRTEGGMWQIQIIAIVLYSSSLLPTALSYFVISSTQKDLPPPRPSISPPSPQFTRLPSVSEPQQKPQPRFKIESMPQARQKVNYIMIQREERSHLIGGRLRDQERIYGRANFFRGTLKDFSR